MSIRAAWVVGIRRLHWIVLPSAYAANLITTSFCDRLLVAARATKKAIV